MTRTLFKASLALALVTAGLSLTATGCATNCVKGVCTSETTTQYVGTAQPFTVAWSSGQDIYIDLPSASVRTGNAATAITVVAGTGSQVTGQFTPFTSETPENKQKAIDEMNANLHMSGTNDAGAVHISATTSGTHGNALSAFVDLVLPAGFNGRILATPGNGDVSIQGAAAGVEVDTKLGDVSVQFVAPLKSTDTGHVVTGQGDITFDLVTTSDISFSALSGDQGAVRLPSPLPTGWVAASSNMATSASFTANGGSASTWRLDSSGFFTSKIEIRAH